MMTQITIYSKESCPYCVRALALLRSKGVEPEIIDVEADSSARAAMTAKGGGWTVPQIFIGDRYLGDCDGIHALDAEGKLDGLLGIESARPEKEETMKRDLIILGAGPAGLTAAIYTARANLAPLVLAGPQPGGQLTITTEVENFPGFSKGVQGPELMQALREQAERFGAEVIDASAESVALKDDPKRMTAGERTIEAMAVIIATGASARWLGIPSEKEYAGKGVSACATCDGFFFRGEEVAIVGGGDTAMEEALFLTRFAKSVSLIHRRDELRGSKIMQKRVLEHPKIKLLWSRVIEEVVGDGKKMTGLRLKDVKTAAIEEHSFGGLFVAIGHKPNTDLFRGQLPLDEAGYIIPPDGGRTATGIPGVFAAGDVRDHYYRQAVSAAGMGCMAAIEAERYLAGL
jgi:thioredoxin reductase (NADPH)